MPWRGSPGEGVLRGFPGKGVLGVSMGECVLGRGGPWRACPGTEGVLGQRLSWGGVVLEKVSWEGCPGEGVLGFLSGERVSWGGMG